MSLFKTYPPSELTLDHLTCMSLKHVLKYIKDMNEAHDKEIKEINSLGGILADALHDQNKEIKTLKHENIGLKEQLKQLKQHNQTNTQG